MDKKQQSMFEIESDKTLREVKEAADLKETEWFWNLLSNHFSEEYLSELNPELILIGTEFPQELAYACSDHPFYILGGSLETTHWSDAITPRDTDPVSQSILGWLMSPIFELPREALIVMTASSDSRRKMAGILRDNGNRVLLLDVIPDNKDERANENYQKQLEQLIGQIEKLFKKEISEKKLIQTTRMVRRARQLWMQFEALNIKKGMIISKSAQIALMQSMYFARNLEEWSRHMDMLIEELDKKATCYTCEKPQILLAGSPIIYPNLKIPQLIEESKMEIAAIADPVVIQIENIPRRGWKTEKLTAMLKRIAGRTVKADASGSRIKNTSLLHRISETLNNYEIEGIIYHVLKGQIEYDFELESVEKLAEERGIPVFRLETDYHYQDVEQLRIRMEAYSEMLYQRYETKERENVI